MELKSVPLELPEGCNIIIGHSHFIKTVEDLPIQRNSKLPHPLREILPLSLTHPRHRIILSR
ncbi:MAG: adenosine-specific kinase [Coleofasciculus sp. E2-BRE-01]|jgi:adenosine/AMP kinase